MNKNILNKIDIVRAKVLENIQLNDKMYAELVKEIGLKEYSLAEEFLFDAVFNSSSEDDYEYFLQECKKQLAEK